MRSGVGVPPPSMPVLPPPMGPQVPSVLGMPSQLQSLPPPPPPSAPGSSGYLRKRKPGDGGDLPLSGMGLPAGARARQKINISVKKHKCNDKKGCYKFYLFYFSTKNLKPERSFPTSGLSKRILSMSQTSHSTS